MLHMEKNNYYGESTSLDLNQLWKKFMGEEKALEQLGASRDCNVDMMPKFLMGNGKLVWTRIHTDVTKHFGYVQDYDENDPKTHNGMDLTKLTTKEAKFGPDDNTIDFISHAIALDTKGQHLRQPALDTVMRMKLYAESLARFQGNSPYGLGELPQAFARLSALYGGTYMMNKPDVKECFLSGLLCVDDVKEAGIDVRLCDIGVAIEEVVESCEVELSGKVLDRNDYYGGESTALNLNQQLDHW